MLMNGNIHFVKSFKVSYMGVPLNIQIFGETYLDIFFTSGT